MQSVKHHLLVAMPHVQGEFFSKSVVYVYEHSELTGAIGFTINKPLSATLGNVMEHLKITVEQSEIAADLVFSGGPVGPDQGFVIHDRMSLSNKPDDCGVTIATSREFLQTIAAGNGPDHFLVTLGYAGWGPGQLEMEIARNDWLVVPFEKNILFDVPIPTRWTSAARLIGIDFNSMSSQVGHA